MTDGGRISKSEYKVFPVVRATGLSDFYLAV